MGCNLGEKEECGSNTDDIVVETEDDLLNTNK